MAEHHVTGENLAAVARRVADKLAAALPEKAAELRAFADRVETWPQPSDLMDFVALLKSGTQQQSPGGLDVGARCGVKVGIEMVLEKFDGEITPGKKPVEAIRSRDEIQL